MCLYELNGKNNYGNSFRVSHPLVGLLLFIFEFEIEGKFPSLNEFQGKLTLDIFEWRLNS